MFYIICCFTLQTGILVKKRMVLNRQIIIGLSHHTYYLMWVYIDISLIDVESLYLWVEIDTVI